MRCFTLIFIILGLLLPGIVHGKVLLNCEITMGATKTESIQILVDEKLILPH